MLGVVACWLSGLFRDLSAKKDTKNLLQQKNCLSLHRFYPQKGKEAAQMAESVDALVSNTSGATRAGSTPALGTTYYFKIPVNQAFSGIFFFFVFPKASQK